MNLPALCCPQHDLVKGWGLNHTSLVTLVLLVTALFMVLLVLFVGDLLECITTASFYEKLYNVFVVYLRLQSYVHLYSARKFT